MNVVRARSNNLPRASASLDGQNVKATPNINLYQEIPTVEVSLDDFEEFALDRLKVRKILLLSDCFIVLKTKDDANNDQLLVMSLVYGRF